MAAALGERSHGGCAAIGGGAAAAVAIRRTGAMGLLGPIALLGLHRRRRLRHGWPRLRLGAYGQAAGAPSVRRGASERRLSCSNPLQALWDAKVCAGSRTAASPRHSDPDGELGEFQPRG